MKKRIQRKIHELRQQPEPVRYRAASYITVASGIVIVILWLAVLLPAQLYLQNRGNRKEEARTSVFNQVKEQIPSFSPLPQVGGISDILSSPTPAQSSSPAPNTSLPSL